ncbi:MAG: RidA family protein [Candidatus Bathyarchaeota archaeon]|nr:RidA family protein [Candidatus Bathyarchaeota archaeon]MDH5745349.1 RidA family protein [Candidatus Bathyarchaeota archaeon]
MNKEYIDIPAGRAVKVGQFIFTFGREGRIPKTGKLVSENAKTQIEQALKNLKEVLEEAGSSMDNVIKATVYLTDINDRERALNEVWARFFPKNHPARTCVQVGLGLGSKVEIELIALASR